MWKTITESLKKKKKHWRKIWGISYDKLAAAIFEDNLFFVNFCQLTVASPGTQNKDYYKLRKPHSCRSLSCFCFMAAIFLASKQV